MGVDHNGYIGPYVRVTATVMKRKVDYCESHNRDNTTYCPTCGRGQNARFVTIDYEGAPDDWQENYKNGANGTFSDYLFSTSHMSPPDIVKNKRIYLYLPNRYYDELNLPHIEGGKYSEEEVPFDDLNVQEITKKFKELYKDEIEYLKQWFDVEVKFGYIGYCS